MGEQLKTAQISMEFVFLVGVAFTVMLVFVASTRSEFSNLQSEEERSLLKDVSVMVQHELVIASNVELISDTKIQPVLNLFLGFSYLKNLGGILRKNRGNAKFY